MRACFLLLLAGCAAGGRVLPPAEHPLDALRLRTNAYRSFHYVGEITDAKTKVRVELGWRAPDRAFLRYGPSYAIYYAGGVGYYYFKQGYLKFDAGAELARLKKEVGELASDGEPEPAFGLTQWDSLLFGRGIRATLGLQRLGARLGWLAELERWSSEGPLYRKEPVEIELREDGFLERVKAGEAAELKATDVGIDVPLDDALFEPPPREGLADLPPAAREDLVRALEDAHRRWALEADAGNRTIEAFVRADIARLYAPEKMAAILKESLDKSLETWKTENPAARADLLREKLTIDMGRTLGSVDLMEKDIQANFDRALDRTLRGIVPPPPRAFMQDVVDRWRAAATREVRRQIREPFERIFEAKMRE